MDTHNLKQTVQRRYGTEEDLKVYRDRADEGLRIWEHRIAEAYFNPGKLLVVGCGGGRESFGLETIGYDVTGIDIVPDQVESARATAESIGSKAVFSVYDGTTIPFDDAQFGNVTLWSQVLGNVPGTSTRVDLLEECRRILEKNGAATFSVHERERTMRRLVECGDTYKHVESGENGDILLEYADGRFCYWHYFDEEEIIRMCRESGFSVLKLTTSDKLGVDWDNLLICVCRKE